jgi:hypothetical protein
MVLTVPEQLSALSSRVSSLETALKRIEALLAPRQPEKPPVPPKWAKPFEGPNGVSYSGPPSEPAGAGGSGPSFGDYSKEKSTQADGSWRDPSGLWRDSTGAIIAPTLKPRGPDRDSAHDVAVRLADEIVAARGQGDT